MEVNNAGSAALLRWALQTDVAGVAVVQEAGVEKNARFERLDAPSQEPWRWLSGPHARVKYDSLVELVRSESRTLAPAPYLSRFERAGQTLEVRLDKAPGGAVALLFDVTGEVRRQRELQREREALLHEERMHAMGVLASGVAHDLNHVLNVIALRVATLRADPAFSSARRTLDALSGVVDNAARIVARLQDLARRRRDRPSDPLDLGAVLIGAVEMARSEAETLGVRIEGQVPPLPLVRGSAAELAHVFGSLLLHAREQLPDGGLIEVAAREDRGRVVVTVRDGGAGIAEQDLSRLFDPFSGAATESALGLSVAWGVLSRLGGSLTASSRRGEGTTFTLVFPVAAPAPREARKPAPQRSAGRVLIIDDEQDNLDVLREVLELEGRDVVTAASGPEALARVQMQGPFDLVLCDVGMPQMSGWQVAAEIQTLAPGTPVWMLTGWAREISDHDPRRRFVQGVLPKPLDLEQLRALLAAPRPHVDSTENQLSQ